MTSPGVQQRLVKMAKFCQAIGDTVQIHAIRVIQARPKLAGITPAAAISFILLQKSHGEMHLTTVRNIMDTLHRLAV